jgi:hypothetical protein
MNIVHIMYLKIIFELWILLFKSEKWYLNLKYIFVSKNSHFNSENNILTLNLSFEFEFLNIKFKHCKLYSKIFV